MRMRTPATASLSCSRCGAEFPPEQLLHALPEGQWRTVCLDCGQVLYVAQGDLWSDLEASQPPPAAGAAAH